MLVEVAAVEDETTVEVVAVELVECVERGVGFVEVTGAAGLNAAELEERVALAEPAELTDRDEPGWPLELAARPEPVDCVDLMLLFVDTADGTGVVAVAAGGPVAGGGPPT